MFYAPSSYCSPQYFHCLHSSYFPCLTAMSTRSSNLSTTYIPFPTTTPRTTKTFHHRHHTTMTALTLQPNREVSSLHHQPTALENNVFNHTTQTLITLIKTFAPLPAPPPFLHIHPTPIFPSIKSPNPAPSASRSPSLQRASCHTKDSGSTLVP